MLLKMSMDRTVENVFLSYKILRTCKKSGNMILKQKMYNEE